MVEHGKLPNKTGMSKKQLHDFAATKEKGLPNKVKRKKKRG